MDVPYIIPSAFHYTTNSQDKILGNKHKISTLVVRKVEQYELSAKFTARVGCAVTLIIYYIEGWLEQAGNTHPRLRSVSRRCDIHEQNERTGQMAEKTEDRNVPEKTGAAHKWKDQHSVQGLVSGGMGMWGMGLWGNMGNGGDGPVGDGLWRNTGNSE